MTARFYFCIDSLVLPAYMIKRFSDVLHAYVDYNFRSLSASKDLKAVESFLEFLPETDKKDITQLIRLKESGTQIG